MVKKKKQKLSSVDIVKYGILISVAVIVGTVVIYSLLYVFRVVGDGSAGDPYRTLANRSVEASPIEVIEFFSYDCPHCRRFETFLPNWLADLPADVEFRQMHVAFSENTRILATAHFVLQEKGILEQNHDRIFQTAAENKTYLFASRTLLAEYLDGHGITGEQFSNLFDSPIIAHRVQQSRALQTAVGITGVPQILVANKYLVLANREPKKMLTVVDDLIANIRDGTLPLPTEETEEMPTPSTDVEPSSSESD